MSSIPGYNLEAFVAWQWNITVVGHAENNISLGLAEMLGNVAQRPILTAEQFKKVLSFYEPYRVDIEERLQDFDEENQSWRSYSEHVESTVPEIVGNLIPELLTLYSERNASKHRYFGIDEEEYLRMNEEAQEYIAEGLPGTDEDIKDILIKFNSIEGVVTRWSCAGHEHEGDKKRKFYIMFNVTEKGLLWMETWFGHLMRLQLIELKHTVHLTHLKKSYRLKDPDTFHEVVMISTGGLIDDKKHKLFLDLVRRTFDLMDC